MRLSDSTSFGNMFLQSVLAIVYTHNGTRSSIFYTKSVPEFLKRINKALAEFEKLIKNEFFTPL